MKRVMIVGQPGSGKSTLARLLGTKTGLPVFHMDHIHWMAGWEERAQEDKFRMSIDVANQEQWVFEGGHSSSYPQRVARADTMIWLDVPLHIRTWRVVTRLIKYYGQTRPDLPDGCPERFGWETLEFLSFIWRTRHIAKARLQQIVDKKPTHLTIIKLRTLKDVDSFLNSI